MIELTHGAGTKMLYDAECGELIALSFAGASAWGIVLKQNEDSGSLVLVLSSTAIGKYPAHIEFDGATIIMSLGKEYKISVSAAHEHMEIELGLAKRLGLLAVHGRDRFICSEPEKDNRVYKWVCLGDGSIRHNVDKGVIFKRWSINVPSGDGVAYKPLVNFSIA
ncbi:hypothetical protein [Nitrospirillum viridazoti]|uniref:hypothetical protein n=1 Tax=Nitrospirillum viridazoti TaxID=3144925 RepID=UPI00110FD0D3|nr:hypothetical protein [Nitrospirillum amazonense]